MKNPISQYEGGLWEGQVGEDLITIEMLKESYNGDEKDNHKLYRLSLSWWVALIKSEIISFNLTERTLDWY